MSGLTQAALPGTQYRRDIDGLRALAVLPVILFHAGIAGFAGGFVGVDVFFVISGYLITTILIADTEAGRFSILKFYERRARRILPALFAMMAGTLALSWFWMPPTPFRVLGKSMVTTTVFAANIAEWRERFEYFADETLVKPLLHCWSLAVEEQFYLAFPLLLFLLWRMGVGWVVVSLALLAVASLFLSEWAVRADPASAFYLPVSRAWELLAGSLCAFALRFRRIEPNGWLAGAGLVAILLSVMLFDRDTPFPGARALLPVAGTAAIILFSGGNGLVNRLLSHRLPVGLGLISYSAYLWHFPLFTLAKLRSESELTPASLLALAVLSLIIAALSWRFVEQPFRTGLLARPANRRITLPCLAVAALLLIGAGLAIFRNDGFPDRIGSAALAAHYAKEAKSIVSLDPACNGRTDISEKCRTGDQPEVLVWGDSFATHLIPGLLASDPELGLQQFTRNGCVPAMEAERLDTADLPFGMERGTPRCAEFNHRVLEAILRMNSVEIVILSSRFTLDEKGFSVRGRMFVEESEKRKRLRQMLMDTVEKIRAAGKKVILFSPTPTNNTNIGACVEKAAFFGRDPQACSFSADQSEKHLKQMETFRFATQGLPVVNLRGMICGSGACEPFQDGIPIYRDRGHLSKAGSQYLGRKYDWAAMVRARAE